MKKIREFEVIVWGIYLLLRYVFNIWDELIDF